MNSTMAAKQNPKWRARFFTIWTGQQLSWLGSAVAQFALIWWVTETTGSATMLATATLVSLLPGIVLGPFIGALVDRWNRRLVMLAADALIALASAWLAYLFWIDALQMWHVYLIMVARSLGVSFHFPAMQASVPLMVPGKHLPRVAGLNQTIAGAVNIMSPPLGAMMLGILPLHAIMAVDVITAIFSVAPLLFIDVPQPPRAKPAAAGESKPSLWEDVKEGLRYIWGWPGLSALLGLAMLLNFIVSPAMTLLPILVTKHFGGGAVQLGWLNSSWGIGLVAGGLFLGVWGGFRRRIATMLLGIAGLGAALLVIGLTPASLFPLALAALFAGGVMNSLTNGVGFALIQGIVAPEMQGRVFMVMMSMANLISPLSMAVAGPVADAAGVRFLYLIAGAISFGIGTLAFFVPVVMNIEDNYQTQVSSKDEKAPDPAQVPLPGEPI